MVDKCPECHGMKIENMEDRLLYCSDCTWYRRIWKQTTNPEYFLEEWTTFCCQALYLIKIVLTRRYGCYIVSLYGFYTKGIREIPDEMRVFTAEVEANNFVEILKERLQNELHAKYIKLVSQPKVGYNDGCWVSMESAWLTEVFTSQDGHQRYVIN